MKKKITLAMAAVMASSCMNVTGYAAGFKDINDVPWDGAKAVINSVADLGLLNGYEDNTFRARNNVTYCEAIQMLYSVLVKTGTAQQLDAAEQYKYTTFMQAYNIPTWAQSAVSYGLEKSLITTTDMAKFMTGKTSNSATRQDVAKMFGNAMAVRYDVDRKAATASKFNDYYRISEDAIILVDVLARLGIINGDTGNNFNPTNNINRAEMAVMLNKTYEVLKNGMETTGTVTAFEGDGSTYKITIKTDAGMALDFNATAKHVKLYSGSTTQELALSRLSVGDKVSFTYNSGALDTIRIVDGSTLQQKYNITGYITALATDKVTIENDNTGETEKIELDSDCLFYLDNKSIKRADLQTELKDNSDKYAYAGINTNSKVEKGKDSSGNSTQVENTYATEVYVTFYEQYMSSGIVSTMDDTSITFKASDSSATSRTYFASGCTYYINETSVSLSQLKSLANSGTVYVKVTVDKTGKATKIILSEESFTVSSDTSSIYEVADLSDTGIVLKNGSNNLTYKFGSTNPVSNITFYKWDTSDDDWLSCKLSNAVTYFDTNDDNNKKVYGKVEFNSGKKINKVYLSTQKSSWSTGSGAYTERTAEVASLSGNTLKFKDSTVAYTLLNQYNVKIDGSKDVDVITGTDSNGNTVKYPLVMLGSPVSSLTVFRKMAESSGVTLYAEIKADGNNVIQSIEARPTAAKGNLVSYDIDEKELVLETTDGKKITFTTARKPSTGTDDYTYEDIGTSGYIGSALTLSFDKDGIVQKINVSENAYLSGSISAKGTAESAANGLKFSGNSAVYGWLSSSNTDLHSYSLNTTSLDRVKSAIEDEDVTVYAEVRLNEKNNVERINVYIKDAKGAFQEYNNDTKLLRILTEDGNKFTFNTVANPTINISGVAKDKVNDLAVGKTVKLTFNSDGLLQSVTG
ncbi:endo-1,4-beta-xylanase A precursor [Anaerotignum neopropionicum]|uniref:Endo-1,4-beta-xylanase A n=1 Tax=Anaerotignum neopropionicum TaxID=36847 RepID=A0A136WIQ2_9FIRM|nr:S-layer homology domain-containing protein [Anaerotignum neopropionicum]KXL54276.1 endo-1,4-beta-xylanase A precursor [Anaerotignum neopropionicum]KXL54401.1 endo-1,4-beta-xylanase A precursor [Anaerotignum neopropionicum]